MTDNVAYAPRNGLGGCSQSQAARTAVDLVLITELSVTCANVRLMTCSDERAGCYCASDHSSSEGEGAMSVDTDNQGDNTIVMEGRNVRLAAALNELSWSCTRLAAAVNEVLGEGYIARTTVSEWLNHGRTPRGPMATVAAHVLSNARGRSTGDRRNFMAVSGDTMAATTQSYVTAGLKRLNLTRLNQNQIARTSSSKVTAAVVGWLESCITGLRKLDDQEGGGEQNRQLTYRLFHQVANWVERSDMADPPTKIRLLKAFASLSQFSGWLAFDAGQHGLSQRYNRTALHAAHSVGDRDFGAHVLGFMTYQAALRGDVRDSIELSDAAARAVEGRSVILQSLVMSRCAVAQAMAGSMHGFRSAYEKAVGNFDEAVPNAEVPSWLYWFKREDLQAQGGCGLVALTARSQKAKTVAEEAQKLLMPRINTKDVTVNRHVVLFSGQLARSYVQITEIEQALRIGRNCMARLQSVSSPRARNSIRKLGLDLTEDSAAATMPTVRIFQKELRSALAA